MPALEALRRHRRDDRSNRIRHRHPAQEMGRSAQFPDGCELPFRFHQAALSAPSLKPRTPHRCHQGLFGRTKCGQMVETVPMNSPCWKRRARGDFAARQDTKVRATIREFTQLGAAVPWPALPPKPLAALVPCVSFGGACFCLFWILVCVSFLSGSVCMFDVSVSVFPYGLGTVSIRCRTRLPQYGLSGCWQFPRRSR
ncbi:hypothetical protein CO731_01513 [Aminobacter sp. MSH1]|nr:hypothetical protein CO731_01513 [Aminobacter sp. MSH1]